jgi:probable rRNA maturation factor
MDITIASRQCTKTVNRRRLKQTIVALLGDLKVANAKLGIYLVAAPEMTQLNETFLKHKGATDVIAFDYAEKVAPASRRHQSVGSRDGGATLHGEIFICVDEAVVQARRFSTNWQSEIVRYMIHGVLHLLGYDDRRADARRKMKREEDRLLRELSLRFPLSRL